jgi:hypothetical protein
MSVNRFSAALYFIFCAFGLMPIIAQDALPQVWRISSERRNKRRGL